MIVFKTIISEEPQAWMAYCLGLFLGGVRWISLAYSCEGCWDVKGTERLVFLGLSSSGKCLVFCLGWFMFQFRFR